MKDYSAMSDEGINKAVAALNPSIYISEDGQPVHLEPSQAPAYTGSDYDEVVFDPCNNPSDAWPIIVENKLHLTTEEDGIWSSRGYSDKHVPIDFKHPNPLRAAMIVYLMMKDAEKQTGDIV